MQTVYDGLYRVSRDCGYHAGHGRYVDRCAVFYSGGTPNGGSGVVLYRMREPGVPTVHEFLAQTLKKGQRLGFDGRCVGASEAEELEKLLSAQGVSITCEEDLVGEIWTDRPALSAEPAWIWM